MGTGPAYMWLTVLLPIVMLLAAVGLQRVEERVCRNLPANRPEQPAVGTVRAAPDVSS